jgi:hypothetical protein
LGKQRPAHCFILYRYARLPYIDYIEPILSATIPFFTVRPQSVDLNVKIENFGQTASQETILKLIVDKEGNKVEIGNTRISPLKAYEKTNVQFSSHFFFEKNKEYAFKISICSKDKEISSFDFKTMPVK